MRRHNLSIVFLASLAGCTATTNTPLASALREIPAEYHGQWVVDLATCNVEGMGNDGDIYISATEVSFHAEPYRVKTLQRSGTSILATYDPPEQQYMEPPAKLYLSADGKELSNLWYRCPKPSK
jgi:outer membrane protein assembly factor BamB